MTLPIYAVCGAKGNHVIRAATGARALELYGDEGQVQRLMEEGPEGVLSIGSDAPEETAGSEAQREIDVTDLATPRGMRRLRNVATGDERLVAKA